MAVVYLDSAYAGSEGAASGDLGFGAGTIFSHPKAAWSSLSSGDSVYMRRARVWTPTTGGFFTNNGINGKQLIINPYGGSASDELPMLDGSYYEDTVSGWSHTGSGVWQKTVNTGGSWPVSPAMWIDTVRPTSDRATWVRGTMMRKANSLGAVNGNNPLSGNGIWWDAVSGSNYVVYVWTGQTGAGGDPVSVYGALRFITGGSTTGAAQYGFNVIGSGASDTEIHSVAAFGFWDVAGGCKGNGGGTVNNVLFDSVHLMGAPKVFLLKSGTAGTLATNIELSGDWIADDMIDPDTAPAVLTGDAFDQNDWEIISLDARSQDITISGGLIRQAGGHGGFSIVTAGGDGSQVRGQRCTVDGTVLVCNPDARNARAFAIVGWDDVTFRRVKMSGASVASKVLGNRTVFSQVEMFDWSACLADQAAGTCLAHIPIANEPGTTLVTVANSIFNGIGREALGATQALAVFQFKASNNSAIPANSITFDNNILLGDDGCAALRVQNGSNAPGASHEVSATQKLRNNHWNTGATARECNIANGGDTTAGSYTTLAARFSAAATAGCDEVALADIFSGGGRAATRRGSPRVEVAPFF